MGACPLLPIRWTASLVLLLAFSLPSMAEDALPPATLKFVARSPNVTDRSAPSSLTGHAYIIVGVNTNFGVKEEVFGFYPATNSLKGLVKGPGMLKSEWRCGPTEECGAARQQQLLNQLSKTKETVTLPLSLEELRKVYNTIKEWDSKSSVAPDGTEATPKPAKEYSLEYRNCIDFVATVAGNLGYPIPGRSELTTPVEYIQNLKPMVEQELKVRDAKRAEQEASTRADTAEGQAKQARTDAAAADARAVQAKNIADAANARAEKAEEDAATAKANSIPVGWVLCTCPSIHAAYGRLFGGRRYHPDTIRCPQ